MLAEIPKQIMQYYKMIDRPPNLLKEKSRNVKGSKIPLLNSSSAGLAEINRGSNANVGQNSTVISPSSNTYNSPSVNNTFEPAKPISKINEISVSLSHPNAQVYQEKGFSNTKAK